MKELEEKIKKLEKMKVDEIEDIEDMPPTNLDKEILKTSQEIWEEVVKIAKKEKIAKLEQFDKNYKIFPSGLENWIEDYKEYLLYCGEFDEKYIGQEIRFLQELMEQFNLEEDVKQEYEAFILTDLDIIGKKEEANKRLSKCIQKYPQNGEFYEIKCQWELEKEKPDIEKVAEILEIAENNETYVEDLEIYQKVAKYYKKIGNEEMENYYESLADFAEENSMKDNFGFDFFEEDDNYDYETFEEEYDKYQEEIREELLDEIKTQAKDKVRKDKKLEDYLKNKSFQEAISFLAPGVMAMEKAEINPLEISPNEINQYILNNREEILKNNLSYIPEQAVKSLEKMEDTGIVEWELENITEEQELEELLFLHSIGIAFAEIKDKKLVFHIPEIKKIKELLKQEKIINTNQDFNEKVYCLNGMCELYGAIKAKKAYHIFEKIYKMEKKDFTRLILMTKAQFPKIEIEINYKTGKVEMIHHEDVDKSFAKEIIKKQKDLKEYSKEEYVYYGKENYIEKTKGYQELEKPPLEDEVDLLGGIVEFLIKPYLFMKRTEGKNADSMLDQMLENISEEENAIISIFFDKNKVKNTIKQIGKEIPIWVN